MVILILLINASIVMNHLYPDQHHGESHQREPLRAVNHNYKRPLSALLIPVQGNSEAQLRQTQGRNGSQYHQSSTSRVIPPIFQPRQHSEQRSDTDQRDRYSDQHTDQRDQQHTNQRSDQYTNQSVTHPFSTTELI